MGKDKKLIAYRYHKMDAVFKLNDNSRDFHELTICLAGNMIYEINGKEFILSGGDILYISPKDKRKREAINENINSYVSINVSCDEDRLLPSSYFKGYVNENIETVLSLMDKADKDNITEKIIPLLDYLLLDITSREKILGENVTVIKIKNYIANNTHKKITVDDIANHVYLSKIYCENIFKKDTGQTIVTYINNEKMKLAKDYLLMPELELPKISELLGFTEYNYFSRLFKKLTGISPLQYRRNKNGK